MEERLQMIEEMLRQNPDDGFLQYAAALEYRKRGKTERAFELLEKLVAEQPDYLGTYYQLGKMHEANGNTEAAISAYKAGIVIAQSQGDRKIQGELNEALMLLEDDDWD